MTNRERLRWYSPGHVEDRIFFDDGRCHYAPGQVFDTLPPGVRSVQYSKQPILRHYPMRNPVQALARAKDRVDSGFQPFYQQSYGKSEREIFVEHFPGIETACALGAGADFGLREEGLRPLLDTPVSLSVITPVTRPENLRAILNSLLRAHDGLDVSLNWFVIIDAARVPEVPQGVKAELEGHPFVTLDYYSGPGDCGNPQRNRGLDLAAAGPGGFVYFLDDDNILHDRLLRVLYRQVQLDPGRKGFLFHQSRHGQCLLAHPHSIRAGHVDTAQVVIHTDLLRTARWPAFGYCADGEFIEQVYNAQQNQFVFVDDVLGYYNQLR